MYEERASKGGSLSQIDNCLVRPFEVQDWMGPHSNYELDSNVDIEGQQFNGIQSGYGNIKHVGHDQLTDAFELQELLDDSHAKVGDDLNLDHAEKEKMGMIHDWPVACLLAPQVVIDDFDQYQCHQKHGQADGYHSNINILF